MARHTVIQPGRGLLGDELLAENHALMMYEPMLAGGKRKMMEPK